MSVCSHNPNLLCDGKSTCCKPSTAAERKAKAAVRLHKKTNPRQFPEYAEMMAARKMLQHAKTEYRKAKLKWQKLGK